MRIVVACGNYFRELIMKAVTKGMSWKRDIVVAEQVEYVSRIALQ